MYNITDLNAMSDEELKTVARDMGMKKIDSTPKDDLIYNILDQQAIDMAANATDRKKRAPKEAKEPRQRRQRTQQPADSDQPQEPPAAEPAPVSDQENPDNNTPAENAAAQKQPSRRGRKKKVQTDTVVTENAEPSESAETPAGQNTRETEATPKNRAGEDGANAYPIPNRSKPKVLPKPYRPYPIPA